MSLERYARTVCGDDPEGVADWQLVARELYNRLSERPDRLLDNAREAVNAAFDMAEAAVDPFTKPADLTDEQLQPVFKLLVTLRRVGTKIGEEFVGARPDTSAPNDLADMSIQTAAEYLTALVEDGCTGYVQPAEGHVYIHHTGDATCPIHET